MTIKKTTIMKSPKQSSNYNKLAIVAFLMPFALVSVFLLYMFTRNSNSFLKGILVTPLSTLTSLILGIIAMFQIKQNKQKGKVFAIISIVINSFIVIFLLLLLFIYLTEGGSIH